MRVVVILLPLLALSCEVVEPESPAFIAPEGPAFETEIRPARALGKLDVEVDGTVVGVDCGVCHVGPNGSPPPAAGEITNVHVKMEFSHGTLSCNGCHNPDDRDTLRLADGRAIDFEQAIDLCAQCHGPQSRDYRRGSHGGMTGYWDTTKGPRVRNHCVNCHDPHAPAFPAFAPAPGPRDRFLTPPQEH